MDGNEVAELMIPAMRRMKFEATVLAAAVGEIIMQAMEQQSAVGPSVRPRTPTLPRNGRIHADDMLKEMGIKIT
jgi:hypothetical protein